MPLPFPAAFLPCGLLLTCCEIVHSTTNTLRVHGRSIRSSSSSSGLGSSISSPSLSSRPSDVSLDSVDSALTVSSNLLDLHSPGGLATWTCPKADRFGINERWTFEDVVFDKPVDSTLPEFYPMYEMNCEKIMISRGLFRFDFLNWGQFIEGSATDDDDKLPLRAVGYYLGQGRFEGCKVKMRSDAQQRKVVKLDCADTSKIPLELRRKFRCFPSTPRASTTPDFNPFATRYSNHHFNRLRLSVLGSAADLTDYSLAVSDNGLFLRLVEEATGLETLFEWERHDLAIPQRKIYLPQPRLEGYYFGQKGPYERCYFQFRAAQKQFVSMRCPREMDRASTPSEFAGQKFLYGDGKAAGLPTPKEDGYYTNDKGEGKEDVLRFENGTVSVRCASEKKGCRTMGLIGPYFYRVILGWSTEDTKMPEYLRLELVDRSNLQPLVMGVAELNLRRDGGAVQVKTIAGEVVLFTWREEEADDEPAEGTSDGSGENGGLVKGKLRRGSTKKKKLKGRGFSFMSSRKESKLPKDDGGSSALTMAVYPYDPRRPLPVRPEPSASTPALLAVLVVCGAVVVALSVLYFYRESMVVVELRENVAAAIGEALVAFFDSSMGRRLFPRVDLDRIRRKFGIDEASKAAFSWMVPGRDQDDKDGRRSEAGEDSSQDFIMSGERVGLGGIDPERPALLYGDAFDVYPVSNWQALRTAQILGGGESWKMDVLGDDGWCRREGRAGVYEIFNYDGGGQPSMILSKLATALPTPLPCVGLSTKPTPVAEFPGHFPYSVGYFSNGLIYSGDWRASVRSDGGGFSSGDTITMIVDRKYDGAKLMGAVYFLKNGSLCHAHPILIESLRLPMGDDGLEPPIRQLECERMLFGGTDFEISCPVTMRPPRPSLAEWGFLPAPYVAVSVVGDSEEAFKVSVNFGADPYVHATEGVAEIWRESDQEKKEFEVEKGRLGSSILHEEAERYARLRTAKILRLRAHGEEAPATIAEDAQETPVPAELAIPGRVENLSAASEDNEDIDSGPEEENLRLTLDLSDRCRFQPEEADLCQCPWFTLGRGGWNLWALRSRPTLAPTGAGERSDFNLLASGSRPASPQHKAAQPAVPSPDELSDERWLALQGRMGDWRRAVVVGQEVWYNVKTSEVTSEEPKQYRYRRHQSEGPPAKATSKPSVAAVVGEVALVVKEDDRSRAEESESRREGEKRPQSPRRLEGRRKSRIIRVGGARPSHRVGDDPVKFHCATDAETVVVFPPDESSGLDDDRRSRRSGHQPQRSEVRLGPVPFKMRSHFHKSAKGTTAVRYETLDMVGAKRYAHSQIWQNLTRTLSAQTAGVITDNAPPKKVYVLTDLFCAMMVMTIWTGSQNILQFLAVSNIALGVVMAFSGPVGKSLPPLVVRSRSELPMVNSFELTGDKIGRYLTPFAVGFFMMYFDFSTCVYASILFYLLVVSVKSSVQVDESSHGSGKRSGGRRPGLMTQLMEGVKSLGDPRLGVLVLNTLITNVFVYPFQTAAVPVILRQMDPVNWKSLASLVSLGGVIGPILSNASAFLFSSDPFAGLVSGITAQIATGMISVFCVMVYPLFPTGTAYAVLLSSLWVLVIAANNQFTIFFNSLQQMVVCRSSTPSILTLPDIVRSFLLTSGASS
ncbi:hypothetical protein FOZ60_006496 [Perkinsus olseni]|uniref:Uncharacterized protein n=1 Tax=Perkinsus olseni TaxID=32597 RepID=A0A7J6NNK7_PEROL|nr:hypothetical protein FOZ60_006496 [Perkinsus olseni]